MEHGSIKSWARDDRPREKMLEKGKRTLSDAELIAILLGSGSTDQTAVELARDLLKGQGNDLGRVARLSIKELCKHKGIGEAKAVSIVAALELGRRRMNKEAPSRKVIQTSSHVFEFIRPNLVDLPHEEFWVVALNRRNAILDKYLVSRGGVSGTTVDPRLVFKPALLGLASAIIVAHNHPSGNLKPSKADIKLTRQIKDAGVLLEIPLLDHLIVGDTSYLSFADEGIL